jgi:hypothetical protein
MPSSGMVSRVALTRTDVSEERSASISVRRIGELGTTVAISSHLHTLRRYTHIAYLRSVCQLLVPANVVPSSSILVTLMKEALSSSETSVLTKSHTA